MIKINKNFKNYEFLEFMGLEKEQLNLLESMSPEKLIEFTINDFNSKTNNPINYLFLKCKHNKENKKIEINIESIKKDYKEKFHYIQTKNDSITLEGSDILRLVVGNVNLFKTESLIEITNNYFEENNYDLLLIDFE